MKDPQKPRMVLDFVWWNEGNPPLQAWTCEGILCAIAKGMSALNGYVCLPREHPWYGVPYDDVPVDVHGGLTFGPDRPGMAEGFKQAATNVGWTGRLPEINENTIDRTLGWIGFDTAHGMDYWPEEELAKAGAELTPGERYIREEIIGINRKHGLADLYGGEVIWTVDAMVEEVNNLARQVANAARA